MNIKPFELVIVIACSDMFAFACLIKADRRVYQYILTPHGRNLFLQICSEQRRTSICTETYSLITGNLHSFFGASAVVSANNECERWYQYGHLHRNGGLTTYVRKRQLGNIDRY